MIENFMNIYKKPIIEVEASYIGCVAMLHPLLKLTLGWTERLNDLMYQSSKMMHALLCLYALSPHIKKALLISPRR